MHNLEEVNLPNLINPYWWSMLRFVFIHLVEIMSHTSNSWNTNSLSALLQINQVLLSGLNQIMYSSLSIFIKSELMIIGESLFFPLLLTCYI